MTQRISRKGYKVILAAFQMFKTEKDLKQNSVELLEKKTWKSEKKNYMEQQIRH